MDAKHWNRQFPTTLATPPSASDTLKFCVICNLHNERFNSIANVEGHMHFSHAHISSQVDWLCGHCALHFFSDTSLLQHLHYRRVRLACARCTQFTTQHTTNNRPLFTASAYKFPTTYLQTAACRMCTNDCLVEYNALQNLDDTAIINVGAEAMALHRGLPCEHGPTRLKRQYSHMLASLPVRHDLYDDLHITGIPGQIVTTHTILSTSNTHTTTTSHVEQISVMTSCASNTVPMIQIPLALWNKRHTKLCSLTRMEEQLSTVFNFQCRLLKQLPAVGLTVEQQAMLQTLLQEHDLPLDFNVGTMLP